MNDLTLSTKIDTRYAEENVCFSICDCSLDKKYSFWCLNKEQAKKFLDKLKHFEKMTWKQLSALPRNKGLTPEKHASQNFDLIHNQSTYEGNIVEQYYFHFRVEQTGLFRVFGYQKKQFFCITHIDPLGKINH
ncbi:MAG: hypothetical protein KAI57_01600 [Candidatus Pacebacteria bacterium]|nr:hypothetical protein [Candidatus Paceibacterota bacterium]